MERFRVTFHNASSSIELREREGKFQQLQILRPANQDRQAIGICDGSSYHASVEVEVHITYGF